MDPNQTMYIVEYLTNGGYGMAWFDSNEHAESFISDMKEKDVGFQIIEYDLSPVEIN